MQGGERREAGRRLPNSCQGSGLVLQPALPLQSVPSPLGLWPGPTVPEGAASELLSRRHWAGHFPL